MNPFRVLIISVVVYFAIGGLGAVAEKIYWIENDPVDDSGVIRRADLDGSNAQDLVVLPAGAQAGAGLALDIPGGKMYWSEELNGRIRRADLTGGNAETLLSERAHPWAVALDLSNSYLYWTQSDNNFNTDTGIFRAGLDGSNVEQLSDVDALALALNVPEGKLYYSQSTLAGPFRANLDASNPVVMVSFPAWVALFDLTFPSSLAVDPLAGKLHFITLGSASPASFAIGRVNLTGSGLERLLARGSTPPFVIGLVNLGLALDPSSNHMYWSNDGNPSLIHRSNLDGTAVTPIYEQSSALRKILALALDLTPGTEIPTLSTWGLLVLGGLMLAAGGVLARRAGTARYGQGS